jgi:Cellulase (glycosyl hydrolase family 5)
MRDRTRHRSLVIGAVGLVLVLAAAGAAVGFNLRYPRAGAANVAPNLRVSGASLVDGSNRSVFLHGVDYSGGEYACIQGWGIFDGPSDQTFVNGLLSTHVNAVRLPMNEDCWLGINGVPAAYSGANYRNAFVAMVNLLTSNGITPELDLQWNAPGSQLASGTKAMPDADHSGAFWQSVATTFAGRTDVIFDLYNEPHPSSWNIWLNGGSDSGFNTIGMQALVSTVRNAGFHGVLSLSGIDYANTLGGSSGWLTHRPSDPDNNLAAAIHVYKGNTHQTTSAWNSDFGPTAAQVPLLNNEFGAYCYDDSCTDSDFANTFWTWLSGVGADGTLAWTWDTWGTVEALVSSYSGPALTSWGQQVKAQYATYGTSGSPVAPPTATSATGAPPVPTSVPPTAVPPTATPVPPVPTTPTSPSTPTTNPPPSGTLSHVQSASHFTDYASTRKSYAILPQPVTAGHLLVAVVSVAGGNPFIVDRVEDRLGNSWKKAVSGVNGDNTDVEIWYTNSSTSGPDEVDAYLKRLPGATSRFVQTYVTVAEFNGAGQFHAGHAAHSSRNGAHASGAFSSIPGDLVVGGYADAGYIGKLAIIDNKSVLGAVFAGRDAIQGIQSYSVAGSASSSVGYSNNHFARAEVAGASFTPASTGAVAP